MTASGPALKGRPRGTLTDIVAAMLDMDGFPRLCRNTGTATCLIAVLPFASRGAPLWFRGRS
jgi:hypothetical protein